MPRHVPLRPVPDRKFWFVIPPASGVISIGPVQRGSDRRRSMEDEGKFIDLVLRESRISRRGAFPHRKA